MKIGSLVRRKPKWGQWVEYNPWMLSAEDLEIGIIVRIGKSGYWDYEVLWKGVYVQTHDEMEIEEVV